MKRIYLKRKARNWGLDVLWTGSFPKVFIEMWWSAEGRARTVLTTFPFIP
jgi:hypothetical protein